jgi:hypothetical protein
MFGIRKNLLISERSLLLYQFTRGAIKMTSNYRGISLLRTSYKILSSILLSRLSPYIHEIIGDHQCGLQCSRAPVNQIFIICQILEKRWEYNETVHQLFVDFKRASDSVTKEVLYNILIEFGVPMKLVRLIKICLNKKCSTSV